MTNEELIECLRCENENYGDCSLHESDCKYRFGIYCAYRQMMLAAADAIAAAEKRIAELEAQMPKEGVWIEDDATYCGADRANYKCSLCGKIGGTWKRGLTQDELPNYCPNCGARMDGAE